MPRLMGIKPRLGASISDGGISFSVWSGAAERVWLCLFDADGNRETERLELVCEGEGVHARSVPGLKAGTRYGFRADGPYAPERGLWFNPDKLLMDPYAVEIDRAYGFDRRLSARRGEGGDTAALMPKAIAVDLPKPVASMPPLFRPGGLIYEVPVKAFTRRHPDVPEQKRGTIAALAEPAIIKHLQKLNVSAVELMPIVAWIDERHLPPLGLTNGWGYNPVSFMALDPRLAPGGLAELRGTVEALRAAGIGVILDLVFNHTGESDALGPTLSLRGLDNRAYYRHEIGEPAKLINDTGTGNSVACNHPVMQGLILDTLRHFVVYAGVDGFRFDLATALGRTAEGFDADAPLLAAMRDDPALKDRIMIAEPWDLGPGGYQLGNFPENFLEWNDKYRDDVRRFWRGDRSMIGALATRLAGSSDIFGGHGNNRTRSLNFIAAHDGATLADLSRYEGKHNQANGEGNRDGHGDNIGWNNGVEGATDDPEITKRRQSDTRALLATLFASRGAIMLTAGDEFGRTQKGNNNAYAQDNELTWLDWEDRDAELERYVADLAAMRKAASALTGVELLSGQIIVGSDVRDIVWLDTTGLPLSEADWNDPECRRLVMVLGGNADAGRFAVLVNGERSGTALVIPAREGFEWESVGTVEVEGPGDFLAPHRAVLFAVERKTVQQGRAECADDPGSAPDFG